MPAIIETEIEKQNKLIEERKEKHITELKCDIFDISTEIYNTKRKLEYLVHMKNKKMSYLQSYGVSVVNSNSKLYDILMKRE